MLLVYQIKVAAHKKSILQKEYKLQTYFTAKGLINYFVIVNKSRSKDYLFIAIDKPILLTKNKKVYFEKIKIDYQKAKEEIVIEASIIHDFKDSQLV